MSGPSRGKRQCPQCKEYVGVRLAKCVCGHEFSASVAKPPKVAKVFDGPGRAIKKCSMCGTYVHAKIRVCPKCQHSFNTVRKERTKPVVTTQVMLVKSKDTKKCQQCKQYVKKKDFECSCGYQFPKKEFDPSTVKIYESGGVGRKQCPSCKSFIAARTSKCACLYDFETHKTEDGKEIEPIVKPKQDENDKWRDPSEEGLIVDFARAVGASHCTVVYAPAGESPIKLYSKTESGFRLFCQALLDYGLESKKLYSPRALRCFGRQFMEQDSKDYYNFYSFVTKWVNEKIEQSLLV